MSNMSQMGDRSNSDNRCRNTRGSNSGRSIKSTEKALSIRVKSRSYLSFFLSYKFKDPSCNHVCRSGWLNQHEHDFACWENGYHYSRIYIWIFFYNHGYGGYVLKYVGDAVIAFFHRPITDYLFFDREVECIKSMITVIKNRSIQYWINMIIRNWVSS
jgi:hypothetical protein